MKKDTNRFENEVKNIFKNVSSYSESSHRVQRKNIKGIEYRITFECRDDINYSKLKSLSQLLNSTENISFNTYESSEGCETCDYGQEFTTTVNASFIE